MRIGVVSDIHGDAEALDRALALMGPVDRLCALGDSIDESCFSPRVVATLRQRDAVAIRGNHEHAFFTAPGAGARRAAVDEPELADWLAARPERVEFTVCDKRVLLVHATPWPSEFEYVAPNSAKFARFAECEADVLLYGHTHQPVVRQVGGTLVVNPGSAGLGRPSEAGFVQSCAVVDVGAGSARIIDFRS